MPRARVVGLLAGGAAAAVATAAAVRLGRSQTVRQEAHRLRHFARPLSHAEPGPPIPPPLPAGRIVLLPGRGEVFVRDTGPRVGAPTVLMLHGWTASADLNFFLAYQELATRYRVVAIDHRGHGRGMRSTERFSLEACADDAAEVLRQLEAAPAVAVGYSMGGPISMLLARRHPGLVAGLVPQATSLEWRGTAYERLTWKLLALMEVGLRAGTGDGFVERILREAIEVQPELEPLQPWLAAEFHRGLTRDLVDAGWALSEYDARPWASSLGLPAVVCVTTRDRLVRPVKQRQLAEALGAEVLEIRGDHDVSFVRGARYSAATRQAVDRVTELAGLHTGAASVA